MKGLRDWVIFTAGATCVALIDAVWAGSLINMIIGVVLLIGCATYLTMTREESWNERRPDTHRSSRRHRCTREGREVVTEQVQQILDFIDEMEPDYHAERGSGYDLLSRGRVWAAIERYA